MTKYNPGTYAKPVGLYQATAAPHVLCRNLHSRSSSVLSVVKESCP